MATKMKASPIDPPKGVPGAELDRLFHGPIEEFTPARNELAKSLRADGKAEAADWVKGLKKPTRAAWLVNQLAVRKPNDVKKLLEVGGELRRGQEELVAGAPDRDALRETAKREQKAIDSLVKTAEALGREHKVGTAILDRVGETLRAAVGDAEVARTIELGRLEREQRAVSVVSIGLTGAVAPPPSRGKRAKSEAAERRAVKETARRRKAAETKAAAADKRVKRAEAAVDKARDALAQKEKALRDAEHDLRSARGELDKI